MLEYNPLTGVLSRNGKEAGWLANTGYRCVSMNNKKYLVHRVAWYIHYGEWPEGDIDHINQDRTDNRIINLRCVTKSVNIRNQRKIKGYHKHQGKYRAMITINNKSSHIGMYDTEEEARTAYLEEKDKEDASGILC